MDCREVFRCAVVTGVVVTVGVLSLVPAGAQVSAAGAATMSATPAAVGVLAVPPVCRLTSGQVRFDVPLPRTVRKLAAGTPITIVALGSSSTFGAGASTPAAAYPSRLAEELVKQLPGHQFRVLNRGVNGEEITDMLARLDRTVIAEDPDLVLWQLGTNSVLRDKALRPHVGLLHEGIARLKASGADVVLIDPQYAPRVLAKPTCEAMVSLIASAAKAEHVGLFRRFELMRHWHEDEHIPFEAFVSHDGLHMNDWGYGCLAKALAAGLVESLTRPTATAGR